MTSEKRGKPRASAKRKTRGNTPPKFEQLALELHPTSSETNPDAALSDLRPSPLPYVRELTPDEQEFVTALAQREDLLEEIALLRLAIFRNEHSNADPKLLVLLVRALLQLVSIQDRLGSDSTRELQSAFSKAMDAMAEKFGREL